MHISTSMYILFCVVVKKFHICQGFFVRVDLGSHGVQSVFVIAGMRLLSNKMATCIKSTTPKWRSTSTKPTTSLNSRKYNWRSSLANSTMHSKGKRSPGSKQVRYFSCVGCLNMAESSVCFCLSLTTISVVQEQILDLEGSYTRDIMSGYLSDHSGSDSCTNIIVGSWHVGIQKQRNKKMSLGGNEMNRYCCIWRHMASLAPVNAVGIFHKERFHFLKDKICLVMAAVIPQ